MPAKHEIQIDEKIIVTKWDGVATDNDFIAVLKAYQKNIQTKSEHKGFNEVFDCTGITKIKITTNGLKKISRISTETDSDILKTKLAFIVSSNLAYGLVRMYDAFRSFEKKQTKEIRVFKVESEAFDWVQNNT